MNHDVKTSLKNGFCLCARLLPIGTDRFFGIVDMGCYEYLPQGFMFSVP